MAITITITTRDLDRASESLLIQIARMCDNSDARETIVWYDALGHARDLTGHAVAMGGRAVVWTQCDEAGRDDYEVYDLAGTDCETLARDHVEDIASGLGSLAAPVPDCSESSHDWQPDCSGCAENPGVHGHGGGVVIREVCAHCGMTRVTDTWSDDGRGGHRESVSYASIDA